MAIALGGMTVAELRGRMTRSEMLDWVAYTEEMGPLNLAVRVEWAVARAVAPFLKNVKAIDLMAWPKEQEQEASISDVFGVLMNAATHSKKG